MCSLIRTFAGVMTYEEFWRPLTQIYEHSEAKAVTQLVFEQRFHLSLADVLCGQTGDEAELHQIQQRLLQGEPVQYVLGLAEFGPLFFHVAPGVLIPRPETYELCQWIIEERGKRKEEKRVTNLTGGQSPCEVLDVGTGSGCIACTLAAALPEAEVTAWDISEEALDIAKDNAKRTNVYVSFEQIDILHQSPSTLQWDLIVSNPPYICQMERAAMEQNVLEYEPGIALFVPDDDPLLFYRTIAEYGQQSLKPGGWLYFEINPLYADDMRQMLSKMSYYDIEIKEDQYGKQRMIRAQR